MKDIVKVKDLKKLLKQHSDEDYVVLRITSYDEEGASAKLVVSGNKKDATLMSAECFVW